MINSADKYQISDILDVEKSIMYQIPKFQREYIWGKDQWENLYNDVYDNEIGHFLGSIICINRGKDTLKIIPMELVDGQQRLTTISLFYAAIFKRLTKEKRKSNDFITDITNIKYRLVHKKRPKKLRLELQTQNSNNEDYRALISQIDILPKSKDLPKNLGNRRLSKTYRYFSRKIDGLSYKETKKLLEKVNSISLVKIEVSNHSDAFMLFESLNNRGVPLSAIDIIKNNLLSNLDKKKLLSLDDAFESWRDLISNLPDASVQERFLRHYYNAFKHKKGIRVKKIHRATKSNLIKIYDAIIKKDARSIFDELYKKAEIYNSFVEPDEDRDKEFYDGLVDLLHIGAAPAYTFLLYLFSEHSRKRSLIKNTINFLSRYFVRRNLTDYPATRDLDAIFMELINQCENNKNKLTYQFVVDFLSTEDKFASISDLKEELLGDLYDENPAVTRYLLCKLEDEHRTRETYTRLWERDNKRKYVWTIEHIFPRGSNIPKSWVKMIAGGDVEKAQELQENYVHTIGNLTITGYNSRLSNFDFIRKRDRKDSRGNHIGFKNGLFLNKDLARKKKWTIRDIEKRTEKLVKAALQMFKIKGEKI